MRLNAANYYTPEMNMEYCSASQWKSFNGYPLEHGCECRAMAELCGDYAPDVSKAFLIGSILDSLWEGLTSDQLADKFPECVSTRGATKGELKAEYKQAFKLYERTLQDKKFCQYMSGDKQVIMTGTIADLPFKIKMDSFADGVAIVDLKTTADMDKWYYIPDSGERLRFPIAYGYDLQLAIYREIVRQNTGDTLDCYIAAVDKREHPVTRIINMDARILDDALETVKHGCQRIISLKTGEIEPVDRCEICDYCRDTYESKVISLSEYSNHDE